MLAKGETYIVCSNERCEKLRFLWKLTRRRFRFWALQKAAKQAQKRSGHAEGGKSLKKKFAATEGGRIVQNFRLGAVKGSTNDENRLTARMTEKTLKNLLSASGLV